MLDCRNRRLTPCRERGESRGRERWVKNLGSGDTNTIWTVTEGEGERERLLHPAKLRRGRRMSKQREERRKAKTGAQESKGDWKGGRSIIDGFVRGRVQNKNAQHVLLSVWDICDVRMSDGSNV